jgi:hypothetical protein
LLFSEGIQITESGRQRWADESAEMANFGQVLRPEGIGFLGAQNKGVNGSTLKHDGGE